MCWKCCKCNCSGISPLDERASALHVQLIKVAHATERCAPHPSHSPSIIFTPYECIKVIVTAV